MSLKFHVVLGIFQVAFFAHKSYQIFIQIPECATVPKMQSSAKPL